MAQIDDLYNDVHEACAPGLWSRGVSIAREGAVHVDRLRDDEILLRCATKDRPAAPRVSLWPQDGDWHCDCRSKDDPCHHVAAAVIALKNNQATLPSSGGEARETIAY